MPIKSLKISFFILIVFCLSAAFAFNLPSAPANYVNDYANIISPSEQVQLNKKLYDVEQQTSNQILVVTVPDLGNLPIEEYSIQLAQRWKIGSKAHDNGVILLLSKAEHKIRIEVGYGLEGALPDAIAKDIIANEISPSLHAGDFDGGIDKGVAAIIQATKNEYHPPSRGTTTSLADLEHGILLFIFLCIFLSRPICWMRMLILYCLGLSSNIHTPFWDSLNANVFTIGGGSSGSGGGGFSGGGGGSFGGGGASGGW